MSACGGIEFLLDQFGAVFASLILLGNVRNWMLFIVVFKRDFSLINSKTSKYAFLSTVPVVPNALSLLADCWLGTDHPTISLGL